MLRAINAVRAANHVPRLHIGARLERAARSHSSDMLRLNYFAHGAFTARMKYFGVQGPLIGENLAWGSGPYASPTAIVQAWLTSPEHRANLLRPGFRRVGVAAPSGPFAGQRRAIVVTADFAGS